ncbi:Hypothetical protein PBC10988_18860 [Planctomycetales bacterium 10988]|nr:Hypothetical protein PBC10988_18860 [Planctomycetales bacterium 10988]
MNFGKYSSQVEEVYSFANSGPLLTPLSIEEQSEINRDQFAMVKYLEEAEWHAWEDTFGSEEETWTDLRELNMAEVLEKAFEEEQFTQIKDHLVNHLPQLTRMVQSRLGDEYFDLLDDIVGDLHNAAFNRAIQGPQGFFEDLFKVYQQGAWPCGWEGNYPEGKLMVHFPLL